ncbi:MAG: hypothetical protein WAL71_02345 [Terriglobales bacterium]
MIRRFLDPDSIGAPQFVAGALLLVYLLQCAWLVHIETQHGSLPDSNHDLCVYHGLEQWKAGAIAGTPQTLRSESITGMPASGHAGHLRVRDGYDQDRSPLYYLTCAAPYLVKPDALRSTSSLGQLWATAPYFFFGVMLGGSLWYVARRLYGNAGGYIALTLYCFSPATILSVAGAPNLGETGGTWGAFGTIFTAIAVAHTLYAPREVVLWNSRRIMLLGLSLALLAGNQFSLAIIAPLALFLMFWVAPVRPRAVIVIWITAVAVGAVLLLASYFFHPAIFWQGLLHARWIDVHPAAFAMSASYAQMFKMLASGSPALMLALPVTLIAYLAWRRTRYFGNTAPLVIAAFLFILAIASPDFPGEGFYLVLLVFLFVFVAGVFADLMETRQGLLITAAVFGLLSASALRNVLQLLFAR